MYWNTSFTATFKHSVVYLKNQPAQKLTIIGPAGIA